MGRRGQTQQSTETVAPSDVKRKRTAEAQTSYPLDFMAIVYNTL